jgi:hypothetical protein
VSEVFEDTPSDKAIWLLVLGAVLGVAGLGALLAPRRG